MCVYVYVHVFTCTRYTHNGEPSDSNSGTTTYNPRDECICTYINLIYLFRRIMAWTLLSGVFMEYALQLV